MKRVLEIFKLDSHFPVGVLFDGEGPKDSELLPLDRIVLNTEAHPLEIFTPHKEWLAQDAHEALTE